MLVERGALDAGEHDGIDGDNCGTDYKELAGGQRRQRPVVVVVDQIVIGGRGRLGFVWEGRESVEKHHLRLRLGCVQWITRSGGGCIPHAETSWRTWAVEKKSEAEDG
ncbi:hypothetical protein L2E82_36088 [Cichorium intybus]|uniref:Uncharacterized protein n=1 Tax=Cichorium intybus TaxID=13427 RepID=A0ACB9BQL3_CICIN|nr:hypothetical protein L2E82_36088 [Cichorium intybus]